MNVCDTKVLYDTEFEATIAAAKHRTEMVIYKCGRHYHLTHANPKKRIGLGGTRKFRRCPFCKQIYGRKSVKAHQLHLKGDCLKIKDID